MTLFRFVSDNRDGTIVDNTRVDVAGSKSIPNDVDRLHRANESPPTTTWSSNRGTLVAFDCSGVAEVLDPTTREWLPVPPARPNDCRCCASCFAISSWMLVCMACDACDACSSIRRCCSNTCLSKRSTFSFNKSTCWIDSSRALSVFALRWAFICDARINTPVALYAVC